MDKDTRAAIDRATQQARRLLEDDFAEQLEGDFDILASGSIGAQASKHLRPRKVYARDKLVAALEHKRSAGLDAAAEVAGYRREAAFTTLNRLVALKMLEARELVQPCLSKGEQSSGYQEFCGMAKGVALLPEGQGYRLYLECLFDELSTEIKVLFDRRDPASVLWPKRPTLLALLEIVNAPALAGVWSQDETIGWVYQYFNGSDERKAMRDPKAGGSQAPRNSREWAVRNQFFTPRYVVQFLTDNTLGRIWYEMRSGETALRERCEYLVHEAYAARAQKDPRDLRVLDPASRPLAPHGIPESRRSPPHGIPESRRSPPPTWTWRAARSPPMPDRWTARPCPMWESLTPTFETRIFLCCYKYFQPPAPGRQIWESLTPKSGAGGFDATGQPATGALIA